MNRTRITAGLIGATIALLGTTANAENLWRDGFNHNPLGGQGTYNSGDYTELHNYDLNRNSLYESTIQDRSGNYYDCDYIGTCHQR